MQRVCLPVSHGIRSSEQLYGASRHKGYERILGRRSSRGHRRLQGKWEKMRRDIYGKCSAGSAKLIVRDKPKCGTTESNTISSCRYDIVQLNNNARNKEYCIVNRDRYKLSTFVGSCKSLKCIIKLYHFVFDKRKKNITCAIL